MGKNLTYISGTSGPPHPLQSTIQPILGVLEQFWPKTLLSRRIPQRANSFTPLHSQNVSGLSAFPRCRFPRLPWPVRSTCSFSCREDGSIFCLGSPRRPTSTSLARFPRRPEHGTARARLLARAPSSKSRRAFVGKTSDATLLSSRGG